MKLSLIHQQRARVDALRLDVARLSSKASNSKSQFTRHTRDIIGQPMVILGAFASGALLVPSSKRKDKLGATQSAAAVPSLSIINSLLAAWALLMRIDRLRGSKARPDDPTPPA